MFESDGRSTSSLLSVIPVHWQVDDRAVNGVGIEEVGATAEELLDITKGGIELTGIENGENVVPPLRG